MDFPIDEGASRPTANGRANGWRRDYSLCDCHRHHDGCPHCGVGACDSTHRGRCHARATS